MVASAGGGGAISPQQAGREAPHSLLCDLGGALSEPALICKWRPCWASVLCHLCAKRWVGKGPRESDGVPQVIIKGGRQLAFGVRLDEPWEGEMQVPG
jgi:hypothetical protein